MVTTTNLAASTATGTPEPNAPASRPPTVLTFAVDAGRRRQRVLGHLDAVLLEEFADGRAERVSGLAGLEEISQPPEAARSN
jgi:hypothetical protein